MPPHAPLHHRFQELNAAASRGAEALAARGVRAGLWQLCALPGLAFLRVYVRQGAWRQGATGFVSALFAAYETFVTYAKLWERQRLTAQAPR